MKVYVVLSIDYAMYEGENDITRIVGVYSSLEKAKVAGEYDDIQEMILDG